MFRTISVLALGLLLAACGSLETYSDISIPVAAPGTIPGTSAFLPGGQSAQGGSSDPGGGGSQPSMGELGTADTEGGTTDEEPDFRPDGFLNPHSLPHHEITHESDWVVVIVQENEHESDSEAGEWEALEEEADGEEFEVGETGDEDSEGEAWKIEYDDRR